MVHSIATYEAQLVIEQRSMSNYLDELSGSDGAGEAVKRECIRFSSEAEPILAHRADRNVSFEALDRMLKAFAQEHASTLARIEALLEHAPKALKLLEGASRSVDIEFKQVTVALPPRLRSIYQRASDGVRQTRNERVLIAKENHRVSEHLTRAIAYLNEVLHRDIRRARKEDSFSERILAKEFDNLAHARSLIEWTRTEIETERNHIGTARAHVEEALRLVEQELQGVRALRQLSASHDPFELDRAA
jgi:hypothetical protein